MKKHLASKIQKQFWILNDMYPDRGTYNLFSVFELSATLNKDLFKKAGDIVVRRHEALRSQYQFENKDIYVSIVDNVDFSIYEYDLDEDYDPNAIHSEIEIEVNKPFDLAKAPLFRFSIFHFKNQTSVLSIVFHHIIIDVRSEGVFSKELGIAYNALIDSRIPIFDSEPIQYSDYIGEVSKWYNTDDYKSKLQGFIANYPDASQKLELPCDVTNTKKIDQNRTGIYFELNAELTNKVSEFAKANITNPYRILLSAYAIFLQRLSTQEMVTIGLPLTNRTRIVSKNTFGCFINALPLEVRFSDKVTITDILKQVDSNLKQNLDRQEIPFTDLVDKGTIGNKSNLNPYFQTGFAFKPPMQLSLEGIEAKPLKVIKYGAQLDLFFTFWEESSHTVGYAEFSPTLFSKDRILDWIDNFKELLLNMLQNPNQKVFELNVLTEKDIKQWKTFNNTETAYEDSICLHEKFEKQVLLTPNSTALLWNDKEISYLELNKEANRLSHLLIHKGVKPGNVVAFSLERCPEIIISILAIHKAGACYLPFDTKAPVDRLNSIIEDSKPKLVITKLDSDGQLTQVKLEKIYVDDILSQPLNNKIENPNVEISSKELAYILYTSGSTGKPKGVMIKHHSVMNKIGWMQFKYNTLESDTLVLKTPVTFDVSVWELFWWFFNGAKLLLLPPGGEKEPETIIAEVEEKKASVIIFVPTMFTSFTAYLEAMEQSHKLSSLKLIIQIGEALSPQLVRDFNKLRTEDFNPLMINTYGPTEATVAVSYYDCPEHGEIDKIYIGKPIFNTQLYVVNKLNQIQPIGVPGELVITGKNLSPGYLNRPELNSDRFTDIIDINSINQRAYKTGDLSFLEKNGELDFMGRIDNQIKLRGYRIELGEIESKILEFTDISNCAVLVHDSDGPNPQLIGYLSAGNKNTTLITELKKFLLDKLPDYMIPAHFLILPEMPLTSSGKINRKVLPKPTFSKEESDQAPNNNIQEILIDIYKSVLEVNKVGVSSNFFELGGTSIMAPMIVIRLKKEYNISIKTLNIFEYPTIEGLSKYISEISSESNIKSNVKSKSKNTIPEFNRDIAVVGMSGCFPGADSLNEYWKNILDGEINIKRFSKEQLIEKGVSEELINNPNYVYANGIIDRGDLFDASFFGITPREADFMDPQHRLFLEVCYEALEDGGYIVGKAPLNIGVFAGAGMNNYLFKSLIKHPSALRNLGEFQTMINNDKDFLTTRVSYKLNLTGPSYDIQTACSTSLVAVHTACQNLINHECDMALAGGAYIHTPRGMGYMFKPGGILSPTGYCKPFDKDANGTVLGEGAGVVLLKRLSDAERDKDNIYAVIKSTAINNDGANKVGYMAPSVDGQSAVILKALDQASIPSESISYIETHGTGTKIGDPIEISSLKKVFKSREKHCALGAVKANIGHLDAAAGVAGLIKTILALKNKQIPPLANFSSYNPDLEIEDSPFYAPTALSDWAKNKYPRRAAISGFGIGGTNAHCIIEEYHDEDEGLANNDAIQLFPVSAKTSKSLMLQSDKLLKFIDETNTGIADTAYTLQTARNTFNHRKFHFGKNRGEIKHNASVIGNEVIEDPQIVFMFTGQGSQYANMGKDLYSEFSVFRSTFDEANDILKKKFNFDIVDLLYNTSDFEQINETHLAQPLIVAVQYSLVKLLKSFGITPDKLIGHSIGELTAACVSGVFSFGDIIELAAHRGKIMHQQERGSMLAVNMQTSELTQYISQNIEISLINAPEFCVVSGSESDILNFKDLLNQKVPQVQTTILKTSHAFHSRFMDGAIEPFKQLVSTYSRNRIQIPFISNSNGELISDLMASSPEYWANHIRKTVDFNHGINTLLEKDSILLEIGPGNMLSSLLSQYSSNNVVKAIPTLGSHNKVENDVDTFLLAIGKYWVNGGEIDWRELHDTNAKKISIPTYAFDRKKHWLDTKNYFSFDIEEDKNNYDDSYPLNNTDVAISIEEEVNFDRSGFSNEYITPENDIHSKLISVWEEFLGLKHIGIADDFFDLGGHSLLASQIINRINLDYKTNLPLDTLFSHPTVASLALLLEKSETGTGIFYEEITGFEYLPVSNDQLRLWIVTLFDNNPAYNIPFTYKIKGTPDKGIFQKSLNILFNRHTILKSKVRTIEGSPALFVDENHTVKVNNVDFTHIPTELRTVQINEFVKNDVQKTFDIANDALYRIHQIHVSENESIFHMTIHHIIFDGWSWGIFVHELNQIYDDLLSGNAISLPPLENQYYDFAHWQTTIMPADIYSKSKSYWAEKLKNHPPKINLNYDYERNARNSGHGGREHFIVDKGINQQLRLISRNAQVTEFTSYISAFTILLNKLSKDTDICIGIPSANRPNSILEKLIGFFVNSLVLRFDINNDLSFLSYIQQNKTVVLEALEHQDLPFEKLVDVLQPPRITNMNPVFQVMFSWLNAPITPLNFKDVESERYSISEGVSPLDITFYMWEENGQIEGEIEFSTDLFSRETIVKMKDSFLSILQNIADNPDSLLKEIQKEEVNEGIILGEVNDTFVPIVHNYTHELFEEQVLKYGTKNAIICNGQNWTYAELNNMANKIANYLLEKNVKENDIVGLCINRSFFMLASVFGILKSGAAYLPLDPSFPKDRLAYMLEDSGAKILITEQKLNDFLFESNVEKLIIDASVSEIEEFSDFKPNVSITPDSLCYIIYTSGSTGKPKGVKVHHKAVVNFIESMASKPGISSNDKLLAVTTLSFDISVLEIFLPLYAGATIVLAQKSEVSNGAALIKLLEENSVTMLQATPATWNILLYSGWKGNKNLKALCGGEAISIKLIERLLPCVKELWNMYGPTETTVWSTCYQITSAETPVLVGRPINNTTIHILSPENKILPVGSSGEVCIGGEGVTKGYHNREDLTTEVFISGPDGNIIYKTGDHGKIRIDGEIELFGRIDNQIKLRGFRIEPGEIEVLLNKLPGIKESVVKVQKFSEIDERLVAFLNTNEGYIENPEDIILYLKRELPDYMIPVHYKALNDFPKTPNWKIDKNALVFEPTDIHSVENNTSLKSLSEKDIENAILKAWKEVLKIENIRNGHNFFEIGGNSILLIQLASLVNKAIGENLDIITYLEYPTIKSLSSFIIKKNTKSDDGEDEKRNSSRFQALGNRRSRNFK